MLPQDIILVIFQFSPTEELFSVIDNKKLAISLLKKLHSSIAYYFVWKKDFSFISTLELSRLAIREDNTEIYNKIKGNVTTFFKCSNAKLAALHNSRKIVADMRKDRTILDCIAYGAAQGGNMDLIDSSYSNWPNLVHGYARGGHTKQLYSIVDLCKYQGLNWFKIAKSAAKGGQRELVQSILDTKGINKHWMAEVAALSGDTVLLDDIIDRGIRYFNEIACSAAKGGHRDIVKKLKYRCTDYSRIACSAAKYGHNLIVYDMIELGANNWNDIAFAAAKGGNKEIVYTMVELGANCFSMIAWASKRIGKKDIYDDMKYRSTDTLSYNTKVKLQFHW